MSDLQALGAGMILLVLTIGACNWIGGIWWDGTWDKVMKKKAHRDGKEKP